MTFRVRIALVVFALTVVTMGSAFGIVWHRFISSQREQLDEALLVVAHREADEAMNGQLELTDAPGPSANAVGPLPKYGVLYGINGLPLSTTNNFQTVPSMPRLAPFELGFDFDHDGVPMRGVVVGLGNTGRRILLATTRIDFEEDKRILTQAMLIAFAVGCLWAAVVAFGVASWLTREHRNLGEVARRVATGDTSARVAFRSTDADLQRLEIDLNAMIQRLVGLVSAQDRFIAHAAHELRTPLAALRLELDHALRSGKNVDDYQSAVRGALDSSRRLSDLAEDLLVLARAKAGPTEDETRVCDALGDAIADVAPIGRSRDVFIFANDVTAMVGGDRRSLARLFRNVLENAVRFSPSGGRVHVESSVEGDRVEIAVRDAGEGVRAEDEDVIFAPFVRGPRVARTSASDSDGDGVGLGLAIARGLARSVGGDVTARPGASGHFVIALPLVS